MLRRPRVRFVAPPTVMVALGARFELGNDAMYVAGGTDLYPNMKRRQQTPRSVISLAGIASLRE
ncbi:MAG TPA: FAD binding domain-containing protein, partial [Gemmatimonadaceae bacterium]|nr:FAD binding domain-containing protein [Gemmatimonadaceae bacterium]